MRSRGNNVVLRFLVAIAVFMILSVVQVACQEDILIELDLSHIGAIEDVWNNETQMTLFNSTNPELCTAHISENTPKYVLSCLVKQYTPYSLGKPTELMAELHSKSRKHSYATFDVSYTADLMFGTGSKPADSVAAPVNEDEQISQEELSAVMTVGAVVGTAAAAYQLKNVISSWRNSRLNAQLALQEKMTADLVSRGAANTAGNGPQDPLLRLLKDLRDASEHAGRRAANSIHSVISRPHRLPVPPALRQAFHSHSTQLDQQLLTPLRTNVGILLAPLVAEVVGRAQYARSCVNQTLVELTDRCGQLCRTNSSSCIHVAQQVLLNATATTTAT